MGLQNSGSLPSLWEDLVTPEAWERPARGAKRPRVLWRRVESTPAGVEELRIFARPAGVRIHDNAPFPRVRASRDPGLSAPIPPGCPHGGVVGVAAQAVIQVRAKVVARLFSTLHPNPVLSGLNALHAFAIQPRGASCRAPESGGASMASGIWKLSTWLAPPVAGGW
jgi:hypothetical protein